MSRSYFNLRQCPNLKKSKRCNHLPRFIWNIRNKKYFYIPWNKNSIETFDFKWNFWILNFEKYIEKSLENTLCQNWFSRTLFIQTHPASHPYILLTFAHPKAKPIFSLIYHSIGSACHHLQGRSVSFGTRPHILYSISWFEVFVSPFTGL